MDLIRGCLAIASNPHNTRWICPLLLVADALLCGLIINFIPYTEIDWKAYMQQIALYLAGERDYTKIRGDTGPLVYPAAHVYIYRALYALTDRGQDIATAQYVFAALYVGTLALVMLCYRQARVPPYVYVLLVASKRVHSLFLLRLFNDCWAVAFLWAAVYCWQRRAWTLGSLAYSVGVGVKMSLVLALPAVGVVLWHGVGRNRALRQAVLMGQVQVLIAFPFLAPHSWSYLTRAFEFTRQFLFKWTVNWRFVGEDVFLSRPFSLTLLAAHTLLLTLFLATRWLKPADVSLSNAVRQLLQPPSETVQARTARRLTPDFILTSILTAVIVGCLCARSLHYQFYAYIAWATPFLLWRSGLHPVVIFAVWAAQEWAWNVYPSTNTSSGVVVGCLTVTVLAVWIGTSDSSNLQTGTPAHDHED